MIAWKIALTLWLATGWCIAVVFAAARLGKAGDSEYVTIARAANWFGHGALVSTIVAVWLT